MRSLPLALLVLLASCTPAEPEIRWLRGNLHTHSFWSDGDDFPEPIIQRYLDAGYDFVALSDHNTLSEGERWIEVTEGRQVAFEAYQDLFGDAVESRMQGDTLEVRLKTFAEFSGHFNRPDSFLVIQSQEISDGFEGKPLHVNATNLVEEIAPQHGSSVTDVLQRNIDAVLEQRDATGQAMVPHVNHPNFGWAVTPDDMVPLTGEHFFEVYNGHPAVHNEGDDERPGTEAMWDYINAHRIHNGHPMLLGLAVDDAHSYHEERIGLANAFRGWVMVRSDSLEPDAIVRALERGDFYASSGVTMDDVRHTDGILSLAIRTEPGVNYTTHFVGVVPGSDQTRVFATVEGPSPQYTLTGAELFVRATVISDRLMPNPYREGETEKAWTQPVR